MNQLMHLAVNLNSQNAVATHRFMDRLSEVSQKQSNAQRRPAFRETNCAFKREQQAPNRRRLHSRLSSSPTSDSASNIQSLDMLWLRFERESGFGLIHKNSSNFDRIWWDYAFVQAFSRIQKLCLDWVEANIRR